jgi:hypothetical protein
MAFALNVSSSTISTNPNPAITNIVSSERISPKLKSDIGASYELDVDLSNIS